ncbi:MAG: alpha/beta fold hydrolase [Candidatus Berkelbacteria bacterium]
MGNKTYLGKIMMNLVFLHGLSGSKNNFEYLEKEFSGYKVISFDLLGFGEEAKPIINYTPDDFVRFIEQKLQLTANDGNKYILVGHSLGAALAKDVAIKYPQKITKIFLLGYPFKLESKMPTHNGSLKRIICEMKIAFRFIIWPLVFLFARKYRKAYLDYFKSTSRSECLTMQNTVLCDNKERLFAISNKVVFINGRSDRRVDLEFAKKFKHFIIKSMGHSFFNHEHQIARITKDNI